MENSPFQWATYAQSKHSLLGSREGLVGHCCSHWRVTNTCPLQSWAELSQAGERRVTRKVKILMLILEQWEEWWLLQLPGMMPCPREARGSQNWVEFGQDPSVFLLVPFIPCSDLNILSTSRIYLDQRKTPLKCQGSFQDNCYIKLASILNSAPVKLLTGQPTLILNH